MSSSIYAPCGKGLGDCWASISYALLESEKLGEPVKFSDHYFNRKGKRRNISYKLHEIIPLFDTTGEILITPQDPDRYLLWSEVYARPYLPTKKKWNRGSIVTYQFDGKSHSCKNLPSFAMEERVLGVIENIGHKVYKLGGDMSLKDAIVLLAGSAYFVGVGSGFAHMAHSVRVPVYMIRNGRTVDNITMESHKYKPMVLVETPEEFIEVIGDSRYGV